MGTIFSLLLSCLDYSIITNVEEKIEVIEIVQENNYYNPTIESFIYYGPPKAFDVLFIVDRSGSMDDDLISFMYEADDLANYFESTDLEWSSTFISSSPYSNMRRVYCDDENPLYCYDITCVASFDEETEQQIGEECYIFSGHYNQRDYIEFDSQAGKWYMDLEPRNGQHDAGENYIDIYEVPISNYTYTNYLSATPQEDIWKSALYLMSFSSSTEHGLESAITFISTNDSVIREDSDLVIISITDERDQSPDGSFNTWPILVSDLKNDPYKVHFVSISGINENSTCGADYSGRILSYASSSYDICNFEDIDGDGRLDGNEDLNGNGQLDIEFNLGGFGDTNFDTKNEDTNGNGRLDRNEDLDCDGHLDVVEDLNNNHILDRLNEDIDGDGRLDLEEDINGNGRLESFEDVDGDGHLDGLEDANNNGVLDYSEDVDNDGSLDFHEDFNNDGILEASEDLDCDGVLDYNEDMNNDGFFNQEDIDNDGNLDLGEKHGWAKYLEEVINTRIVNPEKFFRLSNTPLDSSSIRVYISNIETMDFEYDSERNGVIVPSIEENKILTVSYY